MFRIKVIVLSILAITFSYAQSLYNGVGHIPQNCQEDWTEAGLQFNPPLTADKIIDINDFNGNNDDEKLQDALDYAKNYNGLIIIFFPEGTYTFHNTINLSGSQYNKIIFQGKGDGTVLNFRHCQKRQK